MKLLVDAHYFDGRIAEGVNTYIKGIYSLMPALAPDIDFFFASPRGEELKDVFGNAPNIHYLPLHSKSRASRLLVEFPNLIRRHSIDAAHFQYVAPPMKSCRTIVTLHDVLFLDFPRYFPSRYRLMRSALFRRSARQADVLATVSDYGRQSIAAHFNIDPADIIVTHNAVDPVFFSSQSTPDAPRPTPDARRPTSST